MCGIAGIYHLDGRPVDTETLDRMARALKHRGPDASGTRALGPLGLVHTRLSIIDLTEAGAQPMLSLDGGAWIVFNGEIYDFQQHRTRLESLGYRFRGRSDTEVLLNLYLEEGLDGLARLNGMFAFAIWDLRRRRLVLGRDRTGQKPLLIYRKGATVAFASETAALKTVPELDLELDPDAIPDYLAHGYVPAPRTFHRHVQKLDPGTFLTLEADGSSETRTFWSYPRVAEPAPSFEEATKLCRERVFAAVERRLVADVPLGAFLSGGVDSSVIAACMTKLSPSRVRTFSLGFDGDPRFDESAHAREVAEVLGTEHTELRVGADSFRRLPELIAHWGEPFGDPSALPTAIISELARAHTTVAMTGDGGDEVFAGYARFASTAYPERLPRTVRTAAAALVSKTPAPTDGESRAARGRRFLERLGLELPERLHSWIAAFPPTAHRELTGRLPRPPYPRSVTERHPEEALAYILRLNARTYLQEDLNVKADRASMMHGLELRAPFLDVDLLETVFALPGHYKINRGRRKWLLRKAFEADLPRTVFERPKMGFGMPLGTWFSGPLRSWVEEALRPRNALIYDHVRRAPVDALLDAHFEGRRDHGFEIWALVMLERWLEAKPGSAARAA